MTAPPPFDTDGKNRSQLINQIRSLEDTCNTQDASIHTMAAREGRLFLDSRLMRELLEKIQGDDCGGGRAKDIYCTWVVTSEGRMCIHDAAKEVLEKVATKKRGGAHD